MDSYVFRGDPNYNWTDVARLNDIAHDVLREAKVAVNQKDVLTSNLLSSAGQLQTCLLVQGHDCAVGFGGFYELDAYSSSRLRPDAHIPGDCLHQCLPGPIDLWNRILFNILIGSAS